MDIDFKTSKLEKIFNSEKELVRVYGAINGRLIMRRMSVLAAAITLADVSDRKPERRHQLTGNRKGRFAVDLKHPFRLVLEPNHNPVPIKDDGGINLAEITALTILEVEDYH